jgi:hypothetical protein
MGNLDMILYICFFAAAVLAALLCFHGVGCLFMWWRTRKAVKKQYPFKVPWYWRQSK